MDLLLILLIGLATLALSGALFFGLFLVSAWLFILVVGGLASIWARRAGRRTKPTLDAFRLFVARKP